MWIYDFKNWVYVSVKYKLSVHRNIYILICLRKDNNGKNYLKLEMDLNEYNTNVFNF